MDLLEHYRQYPEVEAGCTIQVEYKSDRKGKRREKVIKKWHRQKRIGFGAFGDIWLEEHHEGDDVEKRAVKIIDKDRMESFGVDYKKEILALARLSKAEYLHEEVFVEFFGWFEDVWNVYLVMENLEFGDLERYTAEPLAEDEVRDITIDVLHGLRIMHALQFAHRDLKPSNIFVVQKPPEHRWSVKIGDFGISKRAHETTQLRTMVGTPQYTAPEITGDIDTEEPTSVYDHFVDMWSLGCVIYKIATQNVLFETPRDLKKFCARRTPFPAPPLGEKMSATGVEFVKKLIVPNPRYRLSAEDAFSEPWILQGISNSVTGPTGAEVLERGDVVPVTTTPSVISEDFFTPKHRLDEIREDSIELQGAFDAFTTDLRVIPAEDDLKRGLDSEVFEVPLVWAPISSLETGATEPDFTNPSTELDGEILKYLAEKGRQTGKSGPHGETNFLRGAEEKPEKGDVYSPFDIERQNIKLRRLERSAEEVKKALSKTEEQVSQSINEPNSQLEGRQGREDKQGKSKKRRSHREIKQSKKMAETGCTTM